jgi:hypothetical protein
VSPSAPTRNAFAAGRCEGAYRETRATASREGPFGDETSLERRSFGLFCFVFFSPSRSIAFGARRSPRRVRVGDVTREDDEGPRARVEKRVLFLIHLVAEMD